MHGALTVRAGMLVLFQLHSISHKEMSVWQHFMSHQKAPTEIAKQRQDRVVRVHPGSVTTT